MKKFLGRVRTVCLIALIIGITAILMPALMYKASAESTEELKLPDIAEKAERFTVLVECWE